MLILIDVRVLIFAYSCFGFVVDANTCIVRVDVVVVFADIVAVDEEYLFCVQSAFGYA